MPTNSEIKYKEMLKSMINERNENKRNKNNELKVVNNKKNKIETNLKEIEEKKLKIQKNNYDLNNIKRINEARIKKLNKQINELKIEEEKYDKLIVKKDLAIENIKKYVDDINDIHKFQIEKNIV